MALPALLLTRPRNSAEVFAATLDLSARAAVRLVIAPLMEIVGTREDPDLGPNEAAIFTSANGVRFAPKGQGRRAFCVGARTTQQAIAREWQARQSGDTAQELIAALCSAAPEAPLVHLGGEHTIGDIAETLTARGIETRHVTLYQQELLPLSSSGLEALGGPCIVPVFSPRSAQHLVDEAKGRLTQAHVIALSDSVAARFDDEKTAQCVVLEAPQAIYMRKAVENLCLALSLP